MKKNRNWESDKTLFNGKEIPYDPNSMIPLMPEEEPENPLQALMQARPGHEPAKSKEEQLDLAEAVSRAVESLEPQDRFIVEAINYERITYIELGERLGISNVHAWRLKNDAYKKLTKVLIQDPIIRKHLRLDDEQ